MDALIQLLPENLVNQIAAGEVVQRPASVVKELLENAKDAGSSHVQLTIKDAGKALIQVTDNGCGMSPGDARMCFERHATSKIQNIDDLFEVRTHGFRGEALASIAAVAQVELRTRRQNDDIGTLIRIEGGKFIKQEPCMCAPGSSVAVSNLFFNVPARRNFLKSNPVETRHIQQEFFRMALANTHLRLELSHNNANVYDLHASDLAKRVSKLYEHIDPDSLIPVQEQTQLITVEGVVGQPQTARKRGDNYFFVNSRFIKNHYLHHAVKTVFDELIEDQQQPFYALNLSIEPKHIDINIHPTKTEIKFDDERTVYALLKSTVKKAIGQFHLSGRRTDEAPEGSFEAQMFNKPASGSRSGSEGGGSAGHSSMTLGQFREQARQPKPRQSAWEALYSREEPSKTAQSSPVVERTPAELRTPRPSNTGLFGKQEQQLPAFQLQNKWIIAGREDALFCIDQHAAHYRIRYEQLQAQHQVPGNRPSQSLLYPVSRQFDLAGYEAINEMLPGLRKLGFQLEPIGEQTLLITGLPEQLKAANLDELLDSLLNDHRNRGAALIEEQLLKLIAKVGAIRNGRPLKPADAAHLASRLLGCNEPYFDPDDRPTLTRLTTEELVKRLG